jgi:hypothetical protein
MSRTSELRHFWAGFSVMSRQQLVLRLLIVALPLAAAAVEVHAGAGPRVLTVGVLLVLVAASALLPASHAPLGAVLLVAVMWVAGVGERFSVSLLLVAALLVAFHVCCHLAGSGPPGTVLDAALLRLWAVRAGVMVAAAVSTWLVGTLVAGARPGSSDWLFAGAMVALVAWAVLLHRLLVRTGPGSH